MNYLKDVKPLEDADYSDDEIVAALKKWTVKPMPILSLKRYLRENGLLNAARNSGSLIAYADGLDDNHDMRHVVDLLADIMLDNRESINTTHGDDAETFYDGLKGLEMHGQITSPTVEDVLALAGGLKYPEVTIDDIVAARAKYQFDQQYADLVNSITGAMETEAVADESTIETIRQAAIDAATGWGE